MIAKPAAAATMMAKPGRNGARERRCQHRTREVTSTN